MIIVGTWATVDDVQELHGVTVTEQQIVMAQALIQGKVRRVWRASDAASGDYLWLQLAVAAQAVHVKDNEVWLSRIAFTSTSQDGWSISYPEGAVTEAWLSRMAIMYLNNLRGAANTSLRFNSAFQRRGRRRGGRGAGLWKNLGYGS